MAAAPREDIRLGRAKAPARPRKGNGVVHALLALLIFTNVGTGVALVMAPELRVLFERDDSVLISAYEERIIELRLEVDRLHSRHYAQAGNLNLQMHELIAQQEILAEQHEYVRALAEQAKALGIEGGDGGSEPIVTGAAPAAGEARDVAQLAETVLDMQDETRMALVALSDAATLSTAEIVTALQDVGIRPAVAGEANGVGGPFIAPREGLRDVSIIEEANAVASALARFRSAREALRTAPIQTPVAGRAQITSGFGNRTDPFLRRAAFHAGIDFRAPTGTAILAAADGTVVFSGTNGGYGKMVDIDHGDGLVTRYAHMSALSVSAGDRVSGGERIGLAGSTGRSTGPHLHFEVRRGDRAVDPRNFIEAGKRLARFF